MTEQPPFTGPLLIDQLHTAAVRDLYWACFSAPLINSATLSGELSNCALQLTPSRRQWLLQLDQQPTALLEHLKTLRSKRLGLYFEHLWHFFLAQDPAVELIAHNLPVRDQGRTLGEFDVIYFCHQRQRAVHLELAVKFYLEASTLERWLGPDCRDHLQRKLDHLLHHQTQLTRTPQGAAALATLGIDSPLRELEMKGRFFASQGSTAKPRNSHARAVFEQWLPASRFVSERLTQAPDTLWLPLSRQQWFAPTRISGHDRTAELTAESLLHRFSVPERPQLCARYDGNGLETARCFITDSSWPWPNETGKD